MRKKITGIYCIENLIDGKKYIGQSQDIYERWAAHKSFLRNKHNRCKYLRNAWNKYGEDKFKFYVIAECRVDELDELEKYYIKELHSHYTEWGYNISFGGSSIMLGRKHSEETIKKMCGRTGNKSPSFGKPKSPETRKKISESLMGLMAGEKSSCFGIPKSDETKKKISDANRGKMVGEKNPFYGKRHSKEFLKRHSLRMRGESSPIAKLTEVQVKEIIELLKNFVDCRKISKIYNVSNSQINSIKHGKSWRYLIADEDLILMGSIRRNKLDKEQVIEIKKLILSGYKNKEIAERYCIAISSISAIRNGISWKDVEPCL